MIIDFHTHIGHFGRSAEHVHQTSSCLCVAGSPWCLPIEAGRCHGDGRAGRQLGDGARAGSLRRVRRRDHSLLPRQPAGARCAGPDTPVPRDRQGAGVRRAQGAAGRRSPRFPWTSIGLCGELGWPVLLHLQYREYSYNFDAFEQVLQACPETVFIGHATAWWANVSADAPSDYRAPDYVSYPTGPGSAGRSD